MNEKSLKVLEEYDLELISARRGRGSYICETSLGTKILADYNGSEKKAAFIGQRDLRELVLLHNVGAIC